MRIKIEFSFQSEQVSLQYRRSFLSFIKHSLSSYHNESFLRYFDKDQCKSKSYTFAIAFPKETSFSRDGITLSQNRCYMTFSTADFVDIGLFYNAFLAQRGKAYPFGKENTLCLVNISYVNVTPILTDKVTVRMMSPLVLREHCKEDNSKDRYVTWKDEDFSKVAQSILEKQLSRVGYANAAIEVTPIHAKATVVSEFDITFGVTIGSLELKGDCEILNYLLESGMGNRRNAGFGLFSLTE